MPTAQNDIQQALGNAIRSNWCGGSFQLALGAQTTAIVLFNDDQADLQVALQNLSNIGAGNVQCTTVLDGDGNVIGYQVEFINALADTNVAQLTVAANTLVQHANTITVTELQAATDGSAVTPTITPVTKVWSWSTSGVPSNSGIIIDGVSSGAPDQFYSQDGVAYFQAWLDGRYGSGAATVTSDNVNVVFTFTGCSPSTITAYFNDDGSPVTPPSYTSGPPEGARVYNITFDSAPTAGYLNVTNRDGSITSIHAIDNLVTIANNLSLYGGASTPQVTGDMASGITLTFSSNDTNFDRLTAGTSTLSTGLGQQLTIVLADSPTAGSFDFTLGTYSGTIPYNAIPNGVLSALGLSTNAWVVSGSAGNWTINATDTTERDYSAADNGTNPLTKSVTLTVSTVQDGVANTTVRNRRLLLGV